jgi:molybdopterin/thiamine biosynthesis adenylyltransferase
MMLSDDDLARYARHIVLKEIGGDGQNRLRAAHAVVVGAGGIGSPAIQYLAAAGIGRLTLVDDDRVDLSNLQRQTIFSTQDVGRAKVDAAAETVVAINPGSTVTARSMRIGSANVADAIAGADVVIDGCDNFTTRLISAAVGQFDGQLAVFRGWEADRPCYRCFVGAAPDRDAGSCAEDGILGPVAGVFGSLAALEAIRAIVPFGEDSAGKLLVADALSLRFRTIALPKDPGCPACSHGRERT